MKPVKAIFVDDEKLQHQAIQNLCSQLTEPVEAYYFLGSKDFFFALEDHLDVDVIFLDVEMPDEDGLTIARRIREILPEVAIIFITAYAQYAIKGYEVLAMDYLLKPVTLNRLEAAFTKVRQYFPQKDEVWLVDKQKINVSDILYLEAQGHACLLHRKNGTQEINLPFNQLQGEAPADFIQTHRSYLVNIQHIFQVNRTEVVLDNGERIPLSRRQAKTVLDVFVNHYKKQAYSL